MSEKDCNVFRTTGVLAFFIGIIFIAFSIFSFTHLGSDYARTGLEWLLALVTIFVGMGCIVLATLLFLLYRKEMNIRKYLIEGNNFVWATFVGYVIDHSYRINGQYGFRAVADYTDPSTEKTYRFYSHSMMVRIPNAVPGVKLKVLIDGDDYSLYMMLLDHPVKREA